MRIKQLLIIALGIALITSCGKDDDDPVVPVAPVVATCSDGVQNQGETGVDCGGPCTACVPPSFINEFTCTIDGVSFITDSITTEYDNFEDEYYIYGYNSSWQTNSTWIPNVMLTLPGNVSVGTHAMGVLDVYRAIYTQHQGFKFGDRSGTMVITAFDPSAQTIAGTFNFKAKTVFQDSVDVQNGSFSIEY